MALFQRFRTGLTLTRASLAVLRTHPTLLSFPLVSGLASLAFGSVLLLSVFVSDLVVGPLAYVALFAFYVVTTFVASFFAAALVSSVNDAFHGRRPTFRAGVAAAWDRRRPLAVWAVLSAVVGVFLSALESSNSMLSRLAGGVFALGWTITTFFVVPVIVFEETSVNGLFSKSAATFRETWGETLSSGFGIGLVQVIFGVIGAVGVLAVGGALFAVVPALGTATVILGFLGVLIGTALVGQTIRGIVKTALYVYATESVVPPAFSGFDIATLGGRAEGHERGEDAPRATPPRPE